MKRKNKTLRNDPSTRDDLGEAGRSSHLHLQSFKDVADSEDEFHLNRDVISLRADIDRKDKSKSVEQEEFLEQSEEEVLHVLSSSSDELLSSESEAEAFDSSDEAESEASYTLANNSHEALNKDEESWGRSKKDYYDADVIETEQDALEEETEALRLQKIQFQYLEELDFGGHGLDDDGCARESPGYERTITEVIPRSTITNASSPSDMKNILKALFPEFTDLAQEFLSLKDVLSELSISQQGFKPAAGDNVAMKTPTETKYEALSAYISVLLMYFALLSSTSAASNSTSLSSMANEVHEHPIVGDLFVARELWYESNKLHEKTEDFRQASNISEEFSAVTTPKIGSAAERSGKMLKRSRQDTEAEDLGRRKKSRSDKPTDASAQQSNERMQDTEADLNALSSQIEGMINRIEESSPNPDHTGFSTGNGDSDELDLGEETGIRANDGSDAGRKRKSLRFYTSQIAQRLRRQEATGKEGDGDTDVPRKERLRDRQATMSARKESRANSDRNTDLPSTNEEHSIEPAVHDSSPIEDEALQYYASISAASQKRKLAKKSVGAVGTPENGLEDRVVMKSESGTVSKRPITYEVEKNKGLTPRRKKEVRNPRVKKRKQYIEKKKKLGSIRQVYKGGEGAGGYKGELTGIKKNIVKSIKL